MLLRAIINSIESVAPRSAQADWDNSGMQVGDTGRDIQSVLLTTDVTPDVVSEAVMCGCQLIVSHHPLLFHGLKQVCGQTPQARVVEQAIKHNIAIYSAHTSLDSVAGGINTTLADKLGITDYHFLTESGLGVIGQLPESVSFLDFIEQIYAKLQCTYVRYTRPVKTMIQTIALCGGSGAEFIDEAINQGADAYLTADCKYHEFQQADGQIGLIDIDHWISERHARDIFRNILEPLGLQCIISKNDKSYINIYSPHSA
ncbi:MAG: Nif3-like dinuclear metal center hexameric protein [Paludibacteraceae bacterium]|nr:Nif3-like dinuclear metal center hexameric protein [Paludibacteraceae bacterium]